MGRGEKDDISAAAAAALYSSIRLAMAANGAAAAAAIMAIRDRIRMCEYFYTYIKKFFDDLNSIQFVQLLWGHDKTKSLNA